jgi:mannose-6-phosphate isomerase-like protein (cupin superfamily)
MTSAINGSKILYMNFNTVPLREERPWGSFITFAHNTPLTVKLLEVLPRQAFSLQRHHKRDEQWHVISGVGHITIGETLSEIIPGGDYFIPRETLHRLESTTEPVIVLEISFGDFDESDITRIEDKYGRN